VKEKYSHVREPMYSTVAERMDQTLAKVCKQ